MATIRGAEHEWEREHRGMARPLPAEFAPIREAPSVVPLRRISKIRSGKLVPHVRHWEELAKLDAFDRDG
jgi:hypothetical protein